MNPTEFAILFVALSAFGNAVLAMLAFWRPSHAHRWLYFCRMLVIFVAALDAVLNFWYSSARMYMRLVGNAQELAVTGVQQFDIPPNATRLREVEGEKGIFFVDATAANTWIKCPNRALEFDGETPLRVMIREQIAGLSKVRRFLDGWCN